MKRLAILLWGLAGVLALTIGWQGRAHQERGVSAQVPAPELLLWRPASVPAPVVAAVPASETPVAAPTPPILPAVIPPQPAACTRLGIFPDADWAAQVGLALLPKAEQGAASWVVKAYPRQRYYVVFTGLDAAALSARLEAHKAQLRRRVSASAQPEPCF